MPSHENVTILFRSSVMNERISMTTMNKFQNLQGLRHSNAGTSLQSNTLIVISHRAMSSYLKLHKFKALQVCVQISTTLLIRSITMGISFSDNVVKQHLNHPGSMQWQADPGVTLIFAMLKNLSHNSISPFSL